LNSGTPSKENLEQLVEEIKSNLRLVNASIIRPEDFGLDQYEKLLEIHRLIQKKEGRLTMMEIEGILEELRELRANAK
jgi:uncharacterized protein YfkK (UPF0435 family)